MMPLMSLERGSWRFMAVQARFMKRNNPDRIAGNRDLNRSSGPCSSLRVNETAEESSNSRINAGSDYFWFSKWQGDVARGSTDLVHERRDVFAPKLGDTMSSLFELLH